MEGWRQRRMTVEDHSTNKGNYETGLTLTGLLMEGLGSSHLNRHILACLCKRDRSQSRFRGRLRPTLTHVRRLTATTRRRVYVLTKEAIA